MKEIQKNRARYFFICCVKTYQILTVNSKKCCRYVPTCSEYVILAIKKYGVVKGLFLGVLRICRCHKFVSKKWKDTPYDPVP